ncbi:5'-methylthioadenosine/S-adenosylhomocysteine nucleosidase [Paenibacillus durus]|nr:5'-methylthioadenosine/S-adenosylhomocysteine nucleosidase [Paenibacillus durus]
MKKWLLFSFAFLLILMPLQVQAASSQVVRPIAVQGAMDMEVAYFLKQMGDYKTETFGSYHFYSGKIAGVPVVVSQTNIGMVNAAASTTLLIEKYHPKAIINQGTAGGHDPALHKFDIVIGEKSINYGWFQSAHRDAGAGVDTGSWKVLTEPVEPDPVLYKTAMSVANRYQHGKVVSGVIGTSDAWNRELDRIKELHDTLGTSAEEMETGSVAEVAKTFNVPFLGIRILSNSELYAEDFDPKSADYCSEFVIEVIKEIESGVAFSDKLQVYADGKEVVGLLGQYVNGQALVPLRGALESLGSEVSWDIAKKQIHVVHGGKHIMVKAGETMVSQGTAWIEADSLQKIFGVKTDVLGSSVYIYE